MFLDITCHKYKAWQRQKMLKVKEDLIYILLLTLTELQLLSDLPSYAKESVLKRLLRYLFVMKKVFNYSELHFSEVTSSKIHTLEKF